jgi:chlorite dismutase
MEQKEKKGHPGGGHPGGGHPGGAATDPNGPNDQKGLTDLAEKGTPVDGERQRLDKRLFMQMLVFDGCSDLAPVIKAIEDSGLEAVIYKDLNNPRGFGLLTMSEDPEFFATELRGLVNTGPLADIWIDGDFTMFGRTYAIGHEADLNDWLLDRPRRVVSTPENQWAIWYPLRRSGEFAKLPGKEQGEILREHGIIGRAFGEAGLGQDIRLACFGLDKNDNDFVIGLVGKELLPLSKLVETMRKTKQTSTYIEQFGPFFIGKKVWASRKEG